MGRNQVMDLNLIATCLNKRLFKTVFNCIICTKIKNIVFTGITKISDTNVIYFITLFLRGTVFYFILINCKESF